MRQYGVAVANGQMLAYFWLLTLTAVLAMVLGGEILIQIGGHRVRLGGAADPADGRRDVDAGALPERQPVRGLSEQAPQLRDRDDPGGGLLHRLHAAAPERHQPRHLRGSDRDADRVHDPDRRSCSPTRSAARGRSTSRTSSMSLATLVAAAIAVGFHFLHPAGELEKLPVIAALMLVWFALLFVLRIIPRYHWEPLRHITKSALRRGRRSSSTRRRACRALKPRDRKALRTAVVDRIPPEVAGAAEEADGRPRPRRWRDGDGDGARGSRRRRSGARRRGGARPAGRHRGRAARAPAARHRQGGRHRASTSEASSTATSPSICSPTSRSRCACERCASS